MIFEFLSVFYSYKNLFIFIYKLFSLFSLLIHTELKFVVQHFIIVGKVRVNTQREDLSSNSLTL